MTGKVIAVANMKGGVGKTATVVALAEALAAEGNSVLVIDADAQANASICIAGDATLSSLILNGQTIDAYLGDLILGGRKLNIADRIYYQASDVAHKGKPLAISLLASSSELRTLEREIIFELTKKKFGLDAIIGKFSRAMKRQLDEISDHYDYVLIDCAPGISALTEASIRIADLVIVPTIPDFLSTYGLKSFCQNLWGREQAHSRAQTRPKKLPHVLITRARRVNAHSRTIARIRNEPKAAQPSFALFETIIPEVIGVPEALARTGTHPTFTNKWRALIPVLSKLSEETEEVLNDT